MMLTQAIVRELLDYDPDTGILTWRTRDRRWFKSDADQKTWNGNFAGKQAGFWENGYRQCTIFWRRYKAHRIIWLWMTGEWPECQIDHENHKRADNRWSNLRDVTCAGNNQNRPLQANNTSGLPGVCWHARDKRWNASIKVGGRKRHLGSFTEKSDAITARKAAEAEHGFHPNHGRAVA